MSRKPSNSVSLQNAEQLPVAAFKHKGLEHCGASPCQTQIEKRLGRFENSFYILLGITRRFEIKGFHQEVHHCWRQVGW